MKSDLKLYLQVVQRIFSIIGLSFTLAVFLVTLLGGYAFFWEPDRLSLLFEIGLFGFGLILQFIPLKD